MNFIGEQKSHKNKYISKLALMLMIAIVLQSFTMLGRVNAAELSDLTAIIESSNKITLNWSDNLTDERSYIIDKKIDSNAYTIFARIGSDTTSHSDGTLSKGHTYTYRIRVIDSTGSSPYIYSEELSISIDDVVKPDSLKITSQASTQIDLQWSYPDQKSYNTIIERRYENDTQWYQIANVGSEQKTYSDTSVDSGTNYYYRVRGCYSNNIKTSPYPNNEIGVLGSSLLEKPTDLSCLVLSQHSIQLTWQDNAAASSFTIERKSPDEGTFKIIAVVAKSITTYIDVNDSQSPIKLNTLYSYRVRANTGSAKSEYSDVVSVSSTYISAPTALSASCIDGQSIKLVWKDSSFEKTGFEIWRKVGTSGLWELYTTMGKNAISFVDTSVSAQNSYSYKIRAKINDNVVYSDYSNEVTIWTSSTIAPSNLSYKTVGQSEVELNWEDTSTVETGYKVERKVGYFGQWTQLSLLEANTTKYNDKSINKTDVYYYRIVAFDTLNSINYSNTVIVSLSTPAAPTNLQATAISSSEVQLSWQDNSNSENEFAIEVMQINTFREIGRVDADVTTFIYKNINPNIALTFRVKAVSGSNQSIASNQAIATTKKFVTFSDLGDVNWAVPAIVNLASKNVFDTKANTKFYPSQYITRGEYCAIIIRSLELGKISAGKFADVTAKHKYYKEIMTAAKLGIISEDINNKISPDKAITREQAAVMLALALKTKGNPLPAEDGSSLKQFADYRSISTAAVDKIAAVCGAGILSGRVINGKTYLQPADYVTRAEAAVIAYKAINVRELNK
ncbi:MAG: S-layer homology domain-containing protein [Ruminiclostridium sp.]